MCLVPVGKAGLTWPLGRPRPGWKEPCLSFVVTGHRVDHAPASTEGQGQASISNTCHWGQQCLEARIRKPEPRGSETHGEKARCWGEELFVQLSELVALPLLLSHAGDLTDESLHPLKGLSSFSCMPLTRYCAHSLYIPLTGHASDLIATGSTWRCLSC